MSVYHDITYISIPYKTMSVYHDIPWYWSQSLIQSCLILETLVTDYPHWLVGNLRWDNYFSAAIKPNNGTISIPRFLLRQHSAAEQRWLWQRGLPHQICIEALCVCLYCTRRLQLLLYWWNNRRNNITMRHCPWSWHCLCMVLFIYCWK